MDDRAGYKVALLVLILGLVMVLFFFVPSSCSEAEPVDPLVAAKQEELHSLREQARVLAKQVDDLRRAHDGLAPAPETAEPHGRSTMRKPLAAEGEGAGDARPEIPIPITKAEALKRIRQTEFCKNEVEKRFNKNSFTSQYGQDWFIFVNYFHHLDKGFYLDIGANAHRELSNTWFLDECLGWDGICVEPDPGLGALLRQHRTCKVVNTCVDSSRRTMALQAAGIAIGHLVTLDKKNEKGKTMTCTTLHDIIKNNNVKHIDFFTLDVEDHEAHVLQTLPEEEDGLTIDMILVENDKSISETSQCHLGNLLRYPFWNRGYGLVGYYGAPNGDDLWVKMGRPNMWRNFLINARNSSGMEKSRLREYSASEVYGEPKKHIVQKFMQRFRWNGRDS